MPTADPAAAITRRRPGSRRSEAPKEVTPPSANRVIDTGSAPKRRAVKAWPASWSSTARKATTTHTAVSTTATHCATGTVRSNGWNRAMITKDTWTPTGTPARLNLSTPAG